MVYFPDNYRDRSLGRLVVDVDGDGDTDKKDYEMLSERHALGFGPSKQSGAYGFSGPARGGPPSYSRPLTADDLGVIGELKDLKGTFSITDKVATIKIDIIEGSIHNPFEIIKNMSTAARNAGADTLRIQAIMGNLRLDTILRARYGLETVNGVDQMTIKLR